MNNELITRLLAFMAGVVLTASYFILTDSIDSQRAQVIPHAPASLSSDSDQSSQQQANVKPIVLAEDIARPESESSQASAELAAQITELKQQLAQQQSQTQQYKAQLTRAYNEPSDLQQELQDRFEQEPRNEQWAYNVETAVNDFLITADLAIAPILESGECKTTICKFKLLAPEDSSNFDHTTWRELNDKLIKQPWWQQFKMTTSQSSDGHYSFVVSTEP